ncbi:hypothetical protein N7G274_001831 [Stereocaulon virgatum]|uniref:Uncharacterized protein n=1 Tax=Stereocaulon virgatum TaxID=373712 RepID=A0ABR4ANX9_9LECA
MAEVSGESRTDHAGDQKSHHLLTVVIPNASSRGPRNICLSRIRRPSPSLAFKVLKVASRTSKQRKSQWTVVYNESSSRKLSIEGGGGDAHDLSDHSDNFAEGVGDEEEGAAGRDQAGQDNGTESEQDGDENGQYDKAELEQDRDASTHWEQDDGFSNYITDDNDEPPLCELKRRSFCEQGQSSGDADHKTSNPSDIHLDPGLDPTLLFQLSCPAALQPFRSQSLKAFDAYIQAEFRALYCNIEGGLQSRLFQQGLLIAQT